MIHQKCKCHPGIPSLKVCPIHDGYKENKMKITCAEHLVVNCPKCYPIDNKTKTAAKMTVEGKSSPTIIKFLTDRNKMPKLDEGKNTGVQDTVKRYRTDAVVEITNLKWILNNLHNDYSDEELNHIALGLEVLAVRINKYLKAKVGGS